MILPSEFIPFAEQHGLITGIDFWVIEEAFRQKEIWDSDGEFCLKICLNISGKTLVQDRLVDFLMEKIECYHIAAEDIELEITETAFINDFEKVIAVLQSLKNLGISIALDDFGTGYSSLTYLRALPIHTLKVDRTFLSNEEKREEKGQFYHLIVELAHCCNLNVVSEGIETLEQMQFAIDNGCDFGQGFFFGRPMKPEEWNVLIRNRKM